MGRPWLLLAAIAVLAVAQIAYHHSQLPEPMASHFDPSGQPDGWMSRPVFYAIHLGLLSLVSLVPALISRALPRLPDSLIQVPRKAYWLAPERRAASVRFLQEELGWIAVAAGGGLVLVAELVFEANLAGDPLDVVKLWGVIAIILTGVALVIVRLLRRFSAEPR